VKGKTSKLNFRCFLRTHPFSVSDKYFQAPTQHLNSKLSPKK
jgi:hypothetical protein